MSVDLRTELNACDAVTGFTGDGPVSVDNTAGFVYEGTNAISTQHSNTDEHIYTTSIGGTRDLSDATCYMILKDNLVETAANGGVQYVLGDGTDRVGFGVGGNDSPGMPLDVFWNSYKLDVTERANAPYNNVYAGVLANLTVASITSVGLGTVHLAKAQGNVDNIKLDRFSFHANGSYALRINGGTVGTPETTADVLGDSITNGWALLANPAGAQYSWFGPTEWGNPAATADAYFRAVDEQWTLFCGAVGATHFPLRNVGNATDTISFELDGVTITNIGTRAQWDMSDTNVDFIKLDGSTFIDLGAITGFAHVANDKYFRNCVFTNNDQHNFGTGELTDCIFNGTTDANGAILIDTTLQTANQTGLVFNQDGSGHGVEITAAGTYNLSGWVFNDFSTGTDANGGSTGDANAAIYVNVAVGTVIINISDGLTPSVRSAGATVTVNNNVNGTFTGMKDNTEIRIYDLSGNELAGIENATAGTTNNRSFTASISGGTPVRVAFMNLDWRVPPNDELFFSWGASTFSIPVTQVVDRTYENP